MHPITEKRMPMKPPIATLTIEQVAELCHVQVRTAQGWARTGRIKGQKIGRRWLFTPESIHARMSGRKP